MQCDDDVVTTVTGRTWAPGSWRSYECSQMAVYEDQEELSAVLAKLSKVPPLVHHAEVDRLVAQLASAARGESFILQGGDCAERFVDCQGERLDAQVQLLVQMGAIVAAATGKPCVRIARLAGQYGKPRSKPTENVPGFGEIFSFKGDNINGYDPKDRKWDPQRLLQGYWHSAATLNYVRALQMSETFSEEMMAPLDVQFLSKSPSFASWSSVATAAKAAAAAPGLFTAHEAMQLDLEEALTREVAGKGFYNLSAHMVWIGDRTRQLLGGHVEYFRGIRNPIGCKVGPSMGAEELKQLVKILNPDNIEGKLVLITRYGNDKVEAMLPPHIKAVQESGIHVVWQADGVHGNTVTAAANKLKTRAYADVLGECTKAIAIHKANGSILAGVHLEMTGQKTVTECTGGCINIFEAMLTNNYETYCDPRLNYGQSIEAAFAVSDALLA
ncbi:hypothetical protein AB1Y20_015825 [Prymnesium parvum]|uniref:Phospho-2-dehydro-3-deoxyheptonate aldolase n=1 Tax=Prymnesium parvum TaxID=97485 RepID=A0AB34K1K0_PRYPA